MNAALFTKSTTGLILASGLIAASSLIGHAQDAPVALGTLATLPLSSYYATIPTGQATLGGHTFDMTNGNMVKLLNGGAVSFAGSYPNAKAVYLLLNTANTYSYLYAGSPVGTVVLTFSDNTTQSTDLVIGGNLREWRIGAAGGVVNTLTDTATAPVWTTTAQPSMGGGTAVLDMLTIPVILPVGTTSKTLTAVTLTDTNPFGALQMDLAGVTADFTPPAPPTPTPTPGSGKGTGNNDDQAGGNHPAHPGDVDKAGQNDDKDAPKPVATKPVVKKTDAEKTDKQDKATGRHSRHAED